jgi:hypothetical protein
VPSQTTRCENGALREASLTLVFIDDEFEPRKAGHLHFGPEAQNPRRLQSFNSPKVERFTFHEVQRVASTAAQSNATEYAVDETPDLPRPRTARITVVAADSFDARPHRLD